MGWLFTNQSLQDLLRDLTRPQEGRAMKSVALDSQYTAGVLWVLVELTAKEAGIAGLVHAGDQLTVICCHLLESSPEGWGYKSMDESSHPYYYSCPLRFLERAPVQSQEWRDKVQAHHARHNVHG